MFAGELLSPRKLFVDTNVFLHVIDSNIYGVADLCKRSGNDIMITQTILNELDPGYYRENEDISSKEIYTAVLSVCFLSL